MPIGDAPHTHSIQQATAARFAVVPPSMLHVKPDSVATPHAEVPFGARVRTAQGVVRCVSSRPGSALRGLSVTRPAQMLAMSLGHQPGLFT